MSVRQYFSAIKVAWKDYQTGYGDLDTGKKAVVDDVAPVMVMCATPKDYSAARRKTAPLL